MTELYAIIIFLFVLFLLLGSSVWVGLALMGVAWVGMELFTSRPAGDAMITLFGQGPAAGPLQLCHYSFGWAKYFSDKITRGYVQRAITVDAIFTWWLTPQI